MVAALVVVAVPAARAEALPVGDPVALGSLTGTDTVSHATSVNEQGDVVGWSWVAPGQRHAFIRFHGAATLVDLGTLGGSNAVANGVNGLGEVTGSSELPGDTVTHAFLWSASGGMVDQGTLGGTNSYGYGIDDVHHIVGTSQITGDGASHAFIVPGPFDAPLAQVLSGVLAHLTSDALRGDRCAMHELRARLTAPAPRLPTGIAEVVRAIHADPMQRMSQGELARRLRMERTRALRCFKAATGQTFREFKRWSGCNTLRS